MLIVLKIDEKEQFYHLCAGSLGEYRKGKRHPTDIRWTEGLKWHIVYDPQYSPISFCPICGDNLHDEGGKPIVHYWPDEPPPGKKDCFEDGHCSRWLLLSYLKPTLYGVLMGAGQIKTRELKDGTFESTCSVPVSYVYASKRPDISMASPRGLQKPRHAGLRCPTTDETAQGRV